MFTKKQFIDFINTIARVYANDEKIAKIGTLNTAKRINKILAQGL